MWGVVPCPIIPIQDRLEIVTDLVERPFLALSSTVQAILRYFEIAHRMKWTFVVDKTNGLLVLDVEKDPEALRAIRRKADLLLK